jgi:uncharacterized protein YecE (DUF72 family)
MAVSPSAAPFYLGCAVWAYKPWVGSFYPRRTTEFLRRYGERLTAVEGNTTFYSVPDEATVARWAEQTPESFRFCLKLPKAVTHYGPLMAQTRSAWAFLDRMEPLGSRLGPMFIQLPPSYGPESMGDLTEFLRQWPQDRVPLAVEVRHRQWYEPKNADRLNALLQDLGIGRVILDSRPVYGIPNHGSAPDYMDQTDDPQATSQRKKPNLPLQPIVTAPFTIVRYISHPDIPRNQAYLEGWADRIAAWLAAGTTVYAFIHCPIEDHSPAIARWFQALLEERGAIVPPLPEASWGDPEPEPQPTQLQLF